MHDTSPDILAPARAYPMPNPMETSSWCLTTSFKWGKVGDVFVIHPGAALHRVISITNIIRYIENIGVVLIHKYIGLS
jgi:hypothetical protein